MNWVCNENYFLKNEELYVLLAAYKLESWYGFGYNEKVNETSDIYKVLSDLYRKGVVDWQDNKAVILYPFNSIFSSLKESKHCIIAGNVNAKTEKAFYFSNDKIVMIEQCLNEKETFSLGFLETNDFKKTLFENDYFPEEIENFPEEDSLPTDYLIFDDKSIKEYLQNDNVISVFEKRNVLSGELYKRIVIQDKGTRGYIYLQNREKCVCLPCSINNCMNVLNDLMD